MPARPRPRPAGTVRPAAPARPEAVRTGCGVTRRGSGRSGGRAGRALPAEMLEGPPWGAGARGVRGPRLCGSASPGAELLVQKDAIATKQNWLTVAPTWKIIGEVHCG